MRDVELELTARELAVLELLLRRPGSIVSKRLIFDSLCSWDNAANTSNVKVFVSRPRRKLSEASAHVGIRVFRCMGYRLEHEAAEARRPDHGLHNRLLMRRWFPQGDSIIAEIALVRSRVHGLPCE